MSACVSVQRASCRTLKWVKQPWKQVQVDWVENVENYQSSDPTSFEKKKIKSPNSVAFAGMFIFCGVELCFCTTYKIIYREKNNNSVLIMWTVFMQKCDFFFIFITQSPWTCLANILTQVWCWEKQHPLPLASSPPTFPGTAPRMVPRVCDSGRWSPPAHWLLLCWTLTTLSPHDVLGPGEHATFQGTGQTSLRSCVCT